MTELYSDFEQIWRLSKVLKGIDTPYWMGIKPNEYIFKYPDGYKEFLQQRIDERIQAYNQQHPGILLNGGTQ